MPTLIAGAVAVFVLYSLLQMFRAANPAVLARAVKIVGGIVALAVAAFTGLRGELAVAIPIGIFGAGLLGWSPFGGSGFNPLGGFGDCLPMIKRRNRLLIRAPAVTAVCGRDKQSRDQGTPCRPCQRTG